MSSCQPQRYELLLNCNVWIAILIYGGETKEPLALAGETGQGVIGGYIIKGIGGLILYSDTITSLFQNNDIIAEDYGEYPRQKLSGHR